MATNQFLLMKDRRFLPLFITQFLGAFHDNLFKNALIVMILYHVATRTGMDEQTQALLTTAAAGTLVLPFFIFSAMGGQLADKYPKHKVMSAIKLAEIGIAVIGSAALLTESLVLSFINLFLLGTHSAFFGPCKYSILPEKINKSELIGGNALLNTGTFLAILLGTIAGMTVMTASSGAIVMCVFMLAVAVSGYISSRRIPEGRAAAPDIVINKNPISETFTVLKYTFRQPRDIVLSLLGKGWFFCAGSLYLSQFPNYVKNTLMAQETVLTLFTVLFSVGIGVGGLLNNRLLRGQVNATFVPLAALGLSLFSIDIYLSTAHVVMPTEGTLYDISGFIAHLAHWRIILDVVMIAVFGGLFVVPLTAILQDRTPENTRAQIMAGSSITDSIFMVGSAVVSGTLISSGWDIRELFLAFAFANVAVAIYICRLLPSYLFKTVLQIIFKCFYQVEIHGFENVEKAGKRAVIVANHVSFLDPPLLAAFLPGQPMFAVNTQVAEFWWVKPFLKLVDAFPLDPTNPYSIKSLIRKVEEDRHIVIFPEGRLTATGSLMKIYDGPGLIADKADAMVLPVRLDGVQYSRFARLRGLMPFKSFPKITITILEPMAFKIEPELKGRSRRQAASRQLYDVMEDMMFRTTEREQTLWDALLKARSMTGGSFVVAEDARFEPMTYSQLVRKSLVLGHYLEQRSEVGEAIGLLLPNSTTALAAFFALQAKARVAAMLNFTMGLQALSSACHTAKIQTIVTSRRFVEMANLGELVNQLAIDRRVIYLEDVASEITPFDKVAALWPRVQPGSKLASHRDPSVILFTSGSEGTPKGVVLSHTNLLSNIVQVASRVAFNQRDVVFNCLPMFHSFGLTGGTLLPVLSGVKAFLYPNPLHIRIVPELVYATNATILFGTDTFLSGYARVANPYDFYGVRYIFAGAEKVKDQTRKTYMDRFGVRILEGYGATETSPVIAVNSPMHQKEGTVGRLLSGMTVRLEDVPGVTEGGRLFVKGPNVMLGYYKSDLPGVLQPPEEGWHDTGDIVAMDEDGYIRILGRAKRFAKIAGEMVSLSQVEAMAASCWPEFEHAAISLPDQKKGEQLVLFTTYKDASRSSLIAFASEKGIPPLAVPATIKAISKLPLLGTGKTDYASLSTLLVEKEGL